MWERWREGNSVREGEEDGDAGERSGRYGERGRRQRGKRMGVPKGRIMREGLWETAKEEGKMEGRKEGGMRV